MTARARARKCFKKINGKDRECYILAMAWGAWAPRARPACRPGSATEAWEAATWPPWSRPWSRLAPACRTARRTPRNETAKPQRLRQSPARGQAPRRRRRRRRLVLGVLQPPWRVGRCLRRRASRASQGPRASGRGPSRNPLTTPSSDSTRAAAPAPQCHPLEKKKKRRAATTNTGEGGRVTRHKAERGATRSFSKGVRSTETLPVDKNTPWSPV